LIRYLLAACVAATFIACHDKARADDAVTAGGTVLPTNAASSPSH